MVVVIGDQGGPARSRRFIAHDECVLSVQRYAVVAAADGVEAVLRRAGRPLDAWGILQEARQQGSPIGGVPMAAIASAARLLQRDGRVRCGAGTDTWFVGGAVDRAKETVA